MYLIEMTYQELDDCTDDPDCMAVVELLKTISTHPSFTDIPIEDIWADHVERGGARSMIERGPYEDDGSQSD